MKHLIAIIGLSLLSLTAMSAQDGKSIYQKYSDAQDVSAVYISPAMFRLIGGIPELKTGDGDVNLTPVVQSLSGMYVLNSANTSVNTKLSSDVRKFITSGKYELLMEAKESGESVSMYTCGDEQVVTSFVMLAEDGDEVTFICLDGRMVRDELEGLVASAAK